MDEFHIGKYVRKMGYASEEEKEETTEKLLTWLKEGKKKEMEEWVEREVAQKDEKKQKKIGKVCPNVPPQINLPYQDEEYLLKM